MSEQEIMHLVCIGKPYLCHNAGNSLGSEIFALNWGALLTENYKRSHCVNGAGSDICIQYMGVQKDDSGYHSHYNYQCSDRCKAGETL